MADDAFSKEKALKTIAKGSGISFVGMMISQIVLYLLRLVLARALTPAEYGVLFLGLSLINILMTLSVLGLDAGIQRYVPYYSAQKDTKRARSVVISSLKISIPFSLFLFVFVFIFSDQIAILVFHEPSLSIILKIFSVVPPLYSLYKIFSNVLLAFKRAEYDIASWHVGRSVLTIVAVSVFLFLGFGTIGATVGYALGFAAAAILAFLFVEMKVFPILKAKADVISMWKKLILFSLPLILYSIMWDITTRIDTLTLGILKTATDVGVYQTAMPTAQFLLIIPSTLSTLFVPVVSELLSRKKMADIESIYKTVSKWSFYIIFPFFLIFFMYPNAVINILFGSEYIVAGDVLRILSIGYLFYSICIFATMMITLFEKTKYYAVNAGIALAIGITLNFYLIQLYGLVGAAIAAMIMYIAYTIITISEVYHLSKFLPFHRDMLKAFVAGVVSMIVFYSLSRILFSQLNLWILAPMLILFIVFYSVLLLVMKGFGKEDILIMKGIEEKTGIRIKPLRNLIKRFV